MDDFGRVCPEEDGAPCQDIALTFWAFGAAGIVCRALPASLSNIAQYRVHQLNLQNVSNIARTSSSCCRKAGRFCQLLASTVLLAFLERRLDHKRLPTRFGTSERWQHMMQLFLRYYCKLARNDCPSTMPKSSPMRSGQLENSAMLGSSSVDAIGDAVQGEIGRIRCPKSCQYSVENGQHGAHKRACVRCHWEALS